MTRPQRAQSLIAIEVMGDRGYLETHPSTVHLGAGRDGQVVVWLDEAEGDGPVLDETRPDRPPEVEMHGEGPPPSALLHHPRAQHAEVFFDALGDPEAAPRGWWHARIWLKAA
jgi:hypothetical protein